MANEATLTKIANELEAIKKLMIFGLMDQGHSQAKIAAAIGTSQASISRMFAKQSKE